MESRNVIMRLIVKDERSDSSTKPTVNVMLFNERICFQNKRNGLPYFVKFEKRNSTLTCRIVDENRPGMRHTRQLTLRLSFVRIQGKMVFLNAFDSNLFLETVVMHLDQGSKAMVKFPFSDINLYLRNGSIINVHGSPRKINLKKAIGMRNLIIATHISYPEGVNCGTLSTNRLDEGTCMIKVNGFNGIHTMMFLPCEYEIPLYPFMAIFTFSVRTDGALSIGVNPHFGQIFRGEVTQRESLPENERPKIISRKTFILKNKNKRAELAKAIKDSKKEDVCGYCCDEKIQCVMFPCFHATSCENCTKKLVSGMRPTEECGLSDPTCPCCRTKIECCIKF